MPIRFQALDGLRGLCAVAVALFHLDLYSHLYSLSIIRNAYLFVDFFFVLSGFVVSNAYCSKLNNLSEMGLFIVRRLGRVWPLHVAVLLFFILVELFKLILVETGFGSAEQPFNEHRSIESIITNILLIQSLGMHNCLTWNFPSWSISAELYTYIVYAILCSALLGYKKAVIPVFSALIILSLCILMSKASESGETYNYGFFRCLAGFSCGAVLSSTYRRFFGYLEKHNTLLEVIAFAMAASFVCVAGNTAYAIFAPIVFSVAVIVCAKDGGLISRILQLVVFQRLGELSYSIYMVHAFIMLNFIDRPVSMIEKITGVSLSAAINTVNNQGAGYGDVKIITLGAQWQADILTTVYIATVVLVARQTHRFVEVPCRNYFNGFATSRRTQRLSAAQPLSPMVPGLALEHRNGGR